MKHCLIGAAWVCAVAAGCTTLREIPRGEYASRPEREHVRVTTQDGLVYEFDFIRVEGDTLVGFRRRDIEGAFEEYGSLKVSLHDLQSLETRTVDWYRTGLIGGGLIAAVVVAGINAASSGGNGGGGPPIRPGP